MLTEWHAKDSGREELLGGAAHYNSVAEQAYQDLLAVDIQRGRDHGKASRAWGI